MKYLIIPIVFLGLVMSGCGSSSSGGSSAPAGNYSGTYTVLVDSDAFGDLVIVQNGSDAAVTYRAYQYTVTETDSANTHTETIAISDTLTGTGTGDVEGRKINVTWGTGAFTRMEFTIDGESFNAFGDASFAGVKQ